MDNSKLLEKKKTGDVSVVAEMIGESEAYTKILFKRTSAKKHQLAINALAKVIEARENAIQNFSTTI